MTPRATAGFTLLEAVLTLALVAVALMLAAGMLEESAVLFAHGSHQLEDPFAPVAVRHLRFDVQGAAQLLSPISGLPVWSSSPLDLGGLPDGTVRYVQVGSTLHRRRYGPSGDVQSDLSVLHSLRSWRWRQIAPGLVDVELTFDRQADLPRWRGGERFRAARAVSTERLRLALRGGSHGRGW